RSCNDRPGARPAQLQSGASHLRGINNMLFSDFALDGRILDALSSKNINEPTPVQRETLPPALDGRDVIRQARTGTGKTLAFALPIADRLEPSSERGRRPRALVLTQPREPATQVATALASGPRHL